ncbi:MAG: hypothetical protein ACLUD1_09640 [Clostridia bacterium]
MQQAIQTPKFTCIFFNITVSLSDEIGDFKWFGKDDDESILSNSLKDEIISYCKKKKLIY